MSDDDNGSASGSVYIYCKDQDGAENWGQVKKLTAADGAVCDESGEAVSISGYYAIVGSTEDDDSGHNAGSAYIYYKDKGGIDNWGQVAKLTASDGADHDWSSYSVSISGDYAVVGAPGDDDNGRYSGSAYIFYKNQGGIGNWGQVTKLTASDGVAGDFFSNSISISGAFAVVGSPYHNENGSYSGSAYIFYKNKDSPGNWEQLTKLTALDGAAEDYFGYSTSISGNYAVVGAYGDKDNGSLPGSAYIFNVQRRGSLQVLIEPVGARDAGARWRRAGTENWRESGDWEHGIPAGYYYVELKQADSWLPPFKQKVTIRPGKETSFTVRYSNNPVRVSFRLHPGPRVNRYGGWRIVGVDWLESGQRIDLVPGRDIFEFKPVPGWYCPPVEVKVRRGETLNLKAHYLPFLVADCSDYNGDGASDISHFRPSDRTWRVANILEKNVSPKDAWPAPGNYRGSSRAAIAFWSPRNGYWRLHGGSGFYYFGEPGELPVPGDYNGDGRTDPALYNPSNGQWLMILSSKVNIAGKQTLCTKVIGGDPYDLPVPGDYDGDGTAEPAIYNLKNRTWTIEGMETVKFGRIGELPVPADYNGDGKTDFAVVDLERGLWRVRDQFKTEIICNPGDILVPGDYNGDGAAEPAIYNVMTYTWTIQGMETVTFGTKEDIPLVRGR